MIGLFGAALPVIDQLCALVPLDHRSVTNLPLEILPLATQTNLVIFPISEVGILKRERLYPPNLFQYLCLRFKTSLLYLILGQLDYLVGILHL